MVVAAARRFTAVEEAQLHIEEWLLRFGFYISNEPVQSDCIEASQMNRRTHQMLKNLGNTSPFEIKLKQLEVSMEIAHRFGEDPTPSEREYCEFMIRHGNKFMRKTAA